MNIVTLRQIPEDNAFRAQWNLLVGQMQLAEIFYTHEWAMAVARAYKDIRPPLVMAGYANGELLAVVALTAGDRRVEFLNANTADYCDFISSAEDREEFVRSVLVELRSMGMRSISLANLPAESRTITILAEGSHCAGFYRFCRKAYNCGQVELATPEQREPVRRHVTGKKGVRRDVAALARLGELKIEHHRGHDDVAPLLPEFYRAHVARFLDKGAISNIARQERRIFLSELAKLLGDAGWMRLSSLTAGRRKIAWNYGFEFGGSWFWYQPTFDTALAKHFPGFCLLTMLVQEAANRECIRRVDLGLGDESYKARLATSHRETLHTILSHSFSSHVKTKLRFAIARIIRKVPKLERVISKTIRPEQSRKSVGVDLPEWRVPAANIRCETATSVEPLTLDLLARVVMAHVDDHKIVEYALAAARMLKSSSRTGFAAVGPDGMPVRIFWPSDCGAPAPATVPSFSEAKI